MPSMKKVKEVGSVILGFILGLWLYDLYQTGGWELFAAEWWKGTAIAVTLLVILLTWDRLPFKR
ncbi:hypothetical protein [Chloroflexus sp.]|uniref:hypothetical protein n=1 Tax=Chloroflexus sp. TaxID=1904827 RepID=UPI00298F1444|nr:hypothetical protein [Chloroflexus sp.]MCS6887383.1 hypothetical protein [Chloroflexus sp.]MCX7860577.1 hypothetical protein [Chloroflexus sp.]MDW8403799.1 hypothetical protein [Chloroflexus sp.]